MNETDTEDTGYRGPTTNRCGIMSITNGAMEHILPGITIDACDTQGSLRKKDVFKNLNTRMLLPESYIIHGIFAKYYGRVWDVLVESPDLPEFDEAGQEYPQIQPVYCQTAEENGTYTTHLVEIKVHEVKHVPVTGGVDWLARAL